MSLPLIAALVLPVQYTNAYEFCNNNPCPQEVCNPCPCDPCTSNPCPCDPCMSDPCIPPCGPEKRRFWNGYGGLAVGAILLGAAAGAGAGYAAGHNNDHHHRCKCPCQVPPPPSCSCNCSCCTEVKGSNLMFNVNFGETSFITIDTESTVTATFFATAPDGSTIIGEVLTFSTGTSDTVSFDLSGSILVCDACCGNYNFGVNIEGSSGITASFTAPFAANVVVNCPQTVTYDLTISQNISSFGTLATQNTIIQINIPFTFAPPCCIKTPSCNCESSCDCN